MEHIKITDLSVGNWVEYARKYYRVTQIDEESEHVLISGLSGVRDKHIDYIEPIHIKPETLEKNGFVNEEEILIERFVLYDKNQKNVELTRCKLGQESSFTVYTYNEILAPTCWLFSVSYLHQLQNALRLAGIDKEIEL